MASQNPLFPNDSGKSSDDAGANPAAELARAKLAKIYGEEPNAQKELAEAEAEPPKELSKHQNFMLELEASGKSIAAIQVEWHNYYQSLSDGEKKEVWDEFYNAQSLVTNQRFSSKQSHSNPATAATSEPQEAPSGAIKTDTDIVVSEHLPTEVSQKAPTKRRRARPSRLANARKPRQISSNIKAKMAAREQLARKNLRAKHNLQSLAFGLATGFIVLLIFMFSFFNENFIAPFIHPGQASATPIILDPSAVSPTAGPEIIIPKINVEIPLVFSVQSTNESDIENALENGVVHYPTTVLPGQKGNTAYFGHSSNNIFSPGNYKFAFVLLHELVPGDIFYITYNKTVYVYKVYDKQIVAPSDVAVLDDVPGHTATATLITCDPPGTSLNRLVVWGDQISPDPARNSGSTVSTGTTSTPKSIAGNGPSLLSRIWPF